MLERSCVCGAVLVNTAKVDVNKPLKNEAIPFYVACEFGHKEVVSLLLADMRIEGNKPQSEGATPSLLVRKVTRKWYLCSWLT